VTILLLESLHPEAEAVLEACETLVRAADPLAPLGDLAEVRAILTRGRGRITEQLMLRCPKLAVVSRPGAGVDNIDVAAAARRGIAVVHAPGANARTVAEHTLALILDAVRGITQSARSVAAGRWAERSSYAGQEVAGLTLGIVGFGAIGRRVAALARAFGMEVVVASRGDAVKDAAAAPHAVLPLPDLLARADVVSLHVPLTPATQGLIGARELARMKRSAYLVNTARGALIEGAALRAAIARGALAGFAADVLDVEPPAADDPLLRSDRVLVTPHIASLTAATYREMCVAVARNVVAVLDGTAPGTTDR
jgi:phosphoglycerate dehydrogenase-like enzyme